MMRTGFEPMGDAGYTSPHPHSKRRTEREAPWWARPLLFPHHVNDHIEHHLYPAIPHDNLPACHRELKARGILD